MEHRDVAFDVMKQVGEVPETTRKLALVITTLLMSGFTMYRANVMLRCDGFTARERLQLFRRGLPWFIGPNGILTAMKQPYKDWFKADFHPSQHAVIHQYEVWVKPLKQPAIQLWPVRHFGKQATRPASFSLLPFGIMLFEQTKLLLELKTVLTFYVDSATDSGLPLTKTTAYHS